MVFGTYFVDRGRHCYRPSMPIVPPLEAVIDRLTPAAKAVEAFDRRLQKLGSKGPVGRLFARLDAVHSSGAEGSTTTFTDLMEYDSIPSAAPDPADAEIVAACAAAFEASLDTPEPLSAILAIHKRLFAGSKDNFDVQSAGQWKTIPNGTRDPDEPDGTFYYTHPSQLAPALIEWLEFTNSHSASVPELLRQICSHWMFESIHPVKDGNGRIGRLLVPLVLKWKRETQTGCVFFGEAVHQDKDLYIGALKDVRRTGDFVPWCRFMLAAIQRTAEDNLERLDKLQGISANWSSRTSKLRSDSSAHRLLPWMLTRPVFSVRDAEAELEVTFATANSAIQSLVDLGIVRKSGVGARNRLFMADQVLDVFDRFRNPAYHPPTP
jgi:Fic family protein